MNQNVQTIRHGPQNKGFKALNALEYIDLHQNAYKIMWLR